MNKVIQCSQTPFTAPLCPSSVAMGGLRCVWLIRAQGGGVGWDWGPGGLGPRGASGVCTCSGEAGARAGAGDGAGAGEGLWWAGAGPGPGAGEGLWGVQGEGVAVSWWGSESQMRELDTWGRSWWDNTFLLARNWGSLTIPGGHTLLNIMEISWKYNIYINIYIV